MAAELQSVQAPNDKLQLVVLLCKPIGPQDPDVRRLQVKLLVEEGDADLWVRDRWDKTPLDEAERVGAQHVARFLRARMDERPAIGARRRHD